MSRKAKENTRDTLLMEQKLNLLASGSKPRIHDGFSWIHKEKKKMESTREIIWQKACVY